MAVELGEHQLALQPNDLTLDALPVISPDTDGSDRYLALVDLKSEKLRGGDGRWNDAERAVDSGWCLRWCLADDGGRERPVAKVIQ